MPYIAPSTRSTGTLITAVIWNQDCVDNPIALRSGAIAMSGQANGYFAIATSVSQLKPSRSFVRVFQEVFG